MERKERGVSINLTCPKSGRADALWATWSVVGCVTMAPKSGVGSTGYLPYRPHYKLNSRALSCSLDRGFHGLPCRNGPGPSFSFLSVTGVREAVPVAG